MSVKGEIFKKRFEKLIKVLKEEKIDGFLTGISTNMYYLSNFHDVQGERFFSLLLTSMGDSILLIPELYRDQVRKVTWVEDIITWDDGEDPFERIYSIFQENKLLNSKIAIDNVLRSDFLLALQEKLTKVNFVAGGKLISTLRRIKTEEEKDLMMKIGSIHDRVFQKAISSIENGISEMQIAEVIVNGFKEWGAKCGSEIPTVGSGLYSALPHYRATEKMISCGDSIILDCCGILNHYYSDMTRTVFVGEPSEEYLKVYDTVRIAQETAFKSVKPGKTCEEIDKVARDIIEDAGYGKYFIHRTGHGIGLEVHEEPYIVKGNKLALEPGMTFSIEPGIYLPNKFGVRIEDCVFVTETGAESFTKLSHDLITIR